MFLVVFTYTCITDTCERHISTNEDTNVALATYDMYVFTNMYLLYLSIHLSIYLSIYLSLNLDVSPVYIYLNQNLNLFESNYPLYYLSICSFHQYKHKPGCFLLARQPLMPVPVAKLKLNLSLWSPVAPRTVGLHRVI